MNYDKVLQEVRRTNARFGSMTPLQICQKSDIWVNHMHLGSSPDRILGFINKTEEKYCITVNCDLPATWQTAVLAHELGHCFLHHLSGCVCTFEDRFSALPESPSETGRILLENEANCFAAELLLDNEETIALLAEYSVSEAARLLGFPEELLKIKQYILYDL